MSVVVEGGCGWCLDACSLIDQGYEKCLTREGDTQSKVKARFKRRCFLILKPHCGVKPGAAAVEENVKLEMLPKKRKRKGKQSHLNQGEIDSNAFHEKVRCVILEETKSLVESARRLGYFQGGTNPTEDPLPGHECNLASLCDMAKDLPGVDDDDQTDCAQLLVDERGCTSHLDLFSRVTEHTSDCAAVVTLMGEEYVIPPHTAFLLSDFSRMEPLLRYGRKFDVIVMDPPWENKSVKRSRRYSSLPSSQLKRLPIPSLASPNCLVVTWVTNRPKHLRFVRDELYPHWGVEIVAEWLWVKVTTEGQFVFPLDSPHKKPYEVLVLGRYCRSQEKSSSESFSTPVENQRLVVSVPSALHSHKPSLSEVLKPYIGGDASCLELFARSLQPGWTSWGNEVLRFQHTSYFTWTPADKLTQSSASSPNED
ncbi:N(6)-adenine-specific methyltransferase METTL4 [Nerophis lumbriciformis]|uniref:N(6)-adenine-specific methyltransferase METTL4 n=1 Tax=Nerophis lumbriciformis TaxID=546530 RepID=UPI002AE00FE8|nr:N(6)-adenine-specific methyltransferase METTL4 isoform X1 [Nerophis lumbriciformis]